MDQLRMMEVFRKMLMVSGASYFTYIIYIYYIYNIIIIYIQHVLHHPHETRVAFKMQYSITFLKTGGCIPACMTLQDTFV